MLSDNTPSQPSKLKTKNWIEINDDAPGTYNTNSQIKFKTSILKWRICNYSDAYILETNSISVTNTVKAAALNNKKPW